MGIGAHLGQGERKGQVRQAGRLMAFSHNGHADGGRQWERADGVWQGNGRDRSTASRSGPGEQWGWMGGQDGSFYAQPLVAAT